MATSKFTPGDWVVTKDLGQDQFIIESEDFTNIAVVPVPAPFDEADTKPYVQEWMVNARLISKAPSMYHLLRRIQQLIVAENLLRKYVVGEESEVVDELSKEISATLRQIDQGGSVHPRKPRMC